MESIRRIQVINRLLQRQIFKTKCRHSLRFSSVKSTSEIFTVQKTRLSVLNGEIDILYADTLNTDCPVVLGIHGVPANHKTFNRVAETFVREGYRVIVPNFPGQGLSPTPASGVYNHTTDDKAQVIKNFMKEMNIERVAVLISHSAGLHTVYRVVAAPSMVGKFQSLCCFAPSGVRPFKGMEHFAHTQATCDFVCKAVKYPELRDAAFELLQIILFRAKNAELQISNAKEVVALDYDVIRQNVTDIGAMNLPFLLFHGEADPTISYKDMEEVAEIWGLSTSEVLWYESDSRCSPEYQANRLKRAVVIKAGDHYPQYSESHIVDIELTAFLQALGQSGK